MALCISETSGLSASLASTETSATGKFLTISSSAGVSTSTTSFSLTSGTDAVDVSGSSIGSGISNCELSSVNRSFLSTLKRGFLTVPLVFDGSVIFFVSGADAVASLDTIFSS